MLQPVESILAEVLNESASAMRKFGAQTGLPDGTGVNDWDREAADMARKFCQESSAAGKVTWRLILEEEVQEAFAESDPTLLRAELLQVMAVCLRWIDAIDERSG